MPPYDLWLQGERGIVGWLTGPGAECKGSRLVPVDGPTARRRGGSTADRVPNGGHEPWSLMVLETRDGKVTGINSFLDTDRLFPLFGLPPHLD